MRKLSVRMAGQNVLQGQISMLNPNIGVNAPKLSIIKDSIASQNSNLD